MSVDDINWFSHCLLSVHLLSRKVSGVESSFIYAPHSVIQGLRTGPTVPLCGNVGTWVNVFMNDSHISAQDLNQTCLTSNFLGILCMCLNVRSTCIHFSLRIGNKYLTNVGKSILSCLLIISSCIFKIRCFL